MPKPPAALQTLPPVVSKSLRLLGEHLALARVRRRESQRSWAKRLGVSVPTLIRLERGDPGIGIGILASALWLMGRAETLTEIADPAHDTGALEQNVREAAQRRARMGRAKERR
jgi:transcriptional regulator with XRE-family HTH domain